MLLIGGRGQEGLLEGLHQFDGLRFVFVVEGRRDGQIVGAITAEVFDCVTFFDKDFEATASVRAILDEDAA